MRILADENVPGPVVDALRHHGHEVLWMAEAAPGTHDAAVLQRAVHDDRVLVTFDKDFGALAYEAQLPASCGIVLFRLPPLSREALARFVAQTLAARDNWIAHFSTVDERRVRMRRLPTGTTE